MFCKNCGAELPNESGFCPKCGKETSLAPTAADAPTSTIATSGPMDSGPYFSSGAAAASPKSKKALFISKKALVILTAVVGMVIIGVVAFFIWRNTTVNQFNIPLGAAYNPKLNIEIHMGESQSDIIKKLGTPIQGINGYYDYDHGISISYTDNVVTSYSVNIHSSPTTNNWMVNGAISLGSPKKNVSLTWGEPSQIFEKDDMNAYFYYYDINGLQTKETIEINTSVVFGFEDDLVSAISVNNKMFK